MSESFPVSKAGALIRQARVLSTMTQAELARRASIAPARISEYETGKREPSISTMDKILLAAGFTLTLDLATADGAPAVTRRARLADMASRSVRASMALEGKEYAVESLPPADGAHVLLARLRSHAR